MKAFSGFMKSKIISNENDKIGLIFYNTVYLLLLFFRY